MFRQCCNENDLDLLSISTPMHHRASSFCRVELRLWLLRVRLRYTSNSSSTSARPIARSSTSPSRMRLEQLRANVYSPLQTETSPRPPCHLHHVCTRVRRENSDEWCCCSNLRNVYLSRGSGQWWMLQHTLSHLHKLFSFLSLRMWLFFFLLPPPLITCMSKRFRLPHPCCNQSRERFSFVYLFYRLHF